MKIYANRQQKSDTEIVDSLIGKEIWIKIQLGLDAFTSYTKILQKFKTKSKRGEEYDAYLYQSIPSCWLDEIEPEDCFSCKQNLIDVMSQVHTAHWDFEGDVIHPLQILTTDEINEILEMYE